MKVFNRFSKVFDCILHDLLLEKLSACGFDYNSLELINNSLSGRKFKMKIGSSYSPNHDLFMGVLNYQSRVLFLLYAYTCGIFFFSIVNLTYIVWTTLPFRLLSKYGPCIEQT